MKSETLASLALSALALAIPAKPAELRVQVVNRTGGASVSLSALSVTLQAHGESGGATRDTSQTDARGRAVFRGLLAGDGRSYSAEVTYQDVKYQSEAVQLRDASARTAVELPVYETTSSRDALRVETQHTVLRPLRGALEVLEMYLVVNPTDRTFVGEDEIKPGTRRVLQFRLPSGFTGLQFGKGMMSCCIVNEADGFVDTMEYKPGQRMVQFQYLLPYAKSSLAFPARFVAPTEQYSLLVVPALRVAKVTGLDSLGEFSTARGSYRRYAAANLGVGASARVELAGLPVDRTPLLRWFALGLGGLSALLLVCGVLRSQRRQTAELSGTSAERERNRIFEDIVQLDRSFEADQIAQTDYDTLRASKKTELAQAHV